MIIMAAIYGFIGGALYKIYNDRRIKRKTRRPNSRRSKRS